MEKHVACNRPFSSLGYFRKSCESTWRTCINLYCVTLTYVRLRSGHMTHEKGRLEPAYRLTIVPGRSFHSRLSLFFLQLSAAFPGFARRDYNSYPVHCFNWCKKTMCCFLALRRNTQAPLFQFDASSLFCFWRELLSLDIEIPFKMYRTHSCTVLWIYIIVLYKLHLRK